MGAISKFIEMLVSAGKKKQFSGGITPYRDNPQPGPSDWTYAKGTLEGGIPGAQAQPSMGHFAGDPEPAFDYRFAGGESDALRGIRNVGDVTRHYDQDAGFLTENVPLGTPGARHGLEVDFPPGKGYDTSIPDMLQNDYVGLTVQRGPQGANRIVSQDMPEFANTPSDLWELISRPTALRAQQSRAKADMNNLVEMFQKQGLDARMTANRTHVIAKQEGGGYRPMESPKTIRNESLVEALQRNYYERTGRRYPGPLQ